MQLKPRICILRKVRLAPGSWQFFSLSRKASTRINDPRARADRIAWPEAPQ